MPTRAIPYVVLLGFLFGSTLIASRFSVGQFHPTTYIGLRMVLATFGHIVFFTSTGRKLPTGRQLWKHATLLGIFGTALPMTAIVTSLLYQSSGITAVLLTAGPAITVLMAHFSLDDEKLTWLKVVVFFWRWEVRYCLRYVAKVVCPICARETPLVMD
jgi:drug/metabolite transporter (DMT)-like permease